MAEMMTTDVRAIMDRTPFDVTGRGRPPRGAQPRPVALPDAARGRGRISASARRRTTKPETHLRLGVGEVLLGRYQLGPRAPQEGRRRRAWPRFFQGLAYENLQQYDEAAKAFAHGGQARLRRQELRAAPRRGPPPHRARRRRRRRSSPASQQAGRLVGRVPLPARRLLAADGELHQAAAEFEKALSLDKDHNGALFELAYINDLFGNDDTAVDLYKRCTERPPVPAGRLDQPGRPLRGRDAVPRGRAVLSPGPRPRPEPSPRPALRQGLPGQQGHVLRRGGRDAATRSSSSSSRSPSPTSSSRSGAGTACGR